MRGDYLAISMTRSRLNTFSNIWRFRFAPHNSSCASQRVRDAQQRRPGPHDHPCARRQMSIALVLGLGRALAMIPRNLGDDLDFLWGEILQIAVADQVGRVLVVRGAA